MAENLEQKQLNFCGAGIGMARRLEDFLNDAAAFAALSPSVGEIPAALTESSVSLQHTVPGDYATLVTRINELVAWFATDFHRDVLHKLVVDA